MPSEKDGPEYTLVETIRELDGWLNKRRSFYPIDTVISAVHWMKAADAVPVGTTDGVTFLQTVSRLEEWLSNDSTDLGIETGEAALYWLRRLQPPPSGGG